MVPLVLATRNQHKARELQSFLSDLDFKVITLDDIPQHIVLEETGTTFYENALQKARIVYDATKLPSLADDSGLEVFFLDGRPGVFSARYAGVNATDEENNMKLLNELRGVPSEQRRAQFRSVLALVAKGIEQTTEGICLGMVAELPRGTNGFGYDPLFIPDGYSCTYAELTAEEKNRISHRSKSFAKMREILLKYRDTLEASLQW
ncbi:MAG: RdgB/HAM1 family non-canonical purine NTP pyrophosphatase [Bacteroidetes bacterium]|nr:RdgB/HAM1 family non-canonical purine NTP pyrophosphatase [Bacteroidota bacterium]